VRRLRKDLIRDAVLCDLPEVHHGDPLRDMAHDREIVCDEEIRESQLGLKTFEQNNYLRSNGHIQRGNGFVADNEVGLDRQCSGNAYALSLSPAELSGVASGKGGIQSDYVQQIPDSGCTSFSRRKLMNIERLREYLSDRLPRIETGVRVLKDHLETASQEPKLATMHGEQILAIELDTPSLRGDDSHQGSSERRLAGP